MSKTINNSAANPINQLLAEVRKVIYGYNDVTEKFAYALFGDGHILLKSVPGLAKTLMVRAFHAAISGAGSKRIQMTPNILPTDIVGGEILNMATGKFEIRRGPVFTNLLLGDEINRATPKAQSALLEAMAERRVSLAGETMDLPDPFLVCATMNPIEQEGTYPLPEAQLDRFMFQLFMDYVPLVNRKQILTNKSLRGRNPLAAIQAVLPHTDIVKVRQQIVETVHVSDAAVDYIVNLVSATHPGEEMFDLVVRKGDAEGALYGTSVQVGGSPRAEQCLAAAASVRAFHRGRDHVRPEDVQYIAPDVLRHRLIMDRKAKMNKYTPERAIAVVLNCVPFHTNLKDYEPKQS